MKMPDGSTQSWALLPPGNLPTYRRENWTEQTIQVGYQVTATGNLGRDGTKKLYATCINIGTGPEKGRQLGRCANAGTVDAGHGRPERRLHRDKPTTTTSTSRATGTTAINSKSPSTTSSRSRCR